MIAFIPFQFTNSKSIDDVKLQRSFASILLLNNIQDDAVSYALYPDSARLKTLSKPLIEENKSIFDGEFQQTFRFKEFPVKELPSVRDCLGYVDGIRASSDGNGFITTGWVSITNKDSNNLDLLAVNEMNRVTGVGISGFTRIDVAQQLGDWGRKSGFQMVSTEIPTRNQPNRVFGK